MNNITLGNSSLLSCDRHHDLTVLTNIAAMLLRPPLNIYIIQLIISRQLVTSEFYTLNEAILAVFICVFDVLEVFTTTCPITSFLMTKRFFLGFTLSARQNLMILITLDRYIAVVKPVVFLKLKQLKYKVYFSGINLLLTVGCCVGSMYMTLEYQLCVVVQRGQENVEGLREDEGREEVGEVENEKKGREEGLKTRETPRDSPYTELSSGHCVSRVKGFLRRILGRFPSLSFLKDEAARWICVLKQAPTF
ncbi:hypothetical protein JOB18_046688 [Solea senegalensis]|uniref:G-protein coupled receptors family 1 profile domain-containing protein n=1 Tax=Solea senegalensis TaxID=28829 RepID=A0AAV6QE12_SOLSE|nr:hypothetical protein JOB18_046688 [Solea senegalensis]